MLKGLMRNIRRSRAAFTVAALIVVASVAATANGARLDPLWWTDAPATTFRVDRQVSIDGQRYNLRVADDVTPRLSPADVQAIVLSRIGADGRIATISVVATRAAASVLERGAGSPLAPELDVGPVWVVRGTGRFVGRHTPLGVAEREAGSGFYMVDDRTGDVLGMGLP